ncbi:unnamed protein product [Didymodactylos carnosus]|uniref:RING-type domain-containing protein n=1 Tax=Didymodactylos carnosus TaxID=1234261 RepID=A0A815QUS7_9BILA|nr:unnamed protein product [Didymodactylos carnosus]CAF1468006.1 unnamed protein product [Didymodactylos carnosus]CAF4124095.1 unnamed protein product [Didymodactylos carnosus]CAF4336724.1 unnamed protein product [Didymodactylos carnosus]
MSTKTDDYSLDEERIVDIKQHEDYLYCSICRNPLWKPVSCKACEKTFCRQCIQQWLSQKDCNRCPFNCKYEEKRCSPLLNSLLSKVRVICQYKDFGCQQIILYESLEKHEMECDYQTEQCHGCKKELLMKDLKQHEEYCDQILVHCDLCHCNIKQPQMKCHVVDCFKKQLKLARTDLTRLMEKYENENKSALKTIHQTTQRLQEQYRILNSSIVNDTNELNCDLVKVKSTLAEFQASIKILQNTSHAQSMLLSKFTTIGSEVETSIKTNDNRFQAVDQRINETIQSIDKDRSRVHTLQTRIQTFSDKTAEQINTLESRFQLLNDQLQQMESTVEELSNKLQYAIFAIIAIVAIVICAICIKCSTLVITVTILVIFLCIVLELKDDERS